MSFSSYAYYSSVLISRWRVCEQWLQQIHVSILFITLVPLCQVKGAKVLPMNLEGDSRKENFVRHGNYIVPARASPFKKFRYVSFLIFEIIGREKQCVTHNSEGTLQRNWEHSFLNSCCYQTKLSTTLCLLLLRGW